MSSFDKTIDQIRREDAIKLMQLKINEMEVNKLKIDEIVEKNKQLKIEIVELYVTHFEMKLE